MSKQAAANRLNTFLDKAAAAQPLVKQGRIRRLQLELTKSGNLASAVKTAFPEMAEGARATLMIRLVKAAAR